MEHEQFRTTIVVDKAIEVSVMIPKKMNAMEFHGLLAKLKRIVTNEIVASQIEKEISSAAQQPVHTELQQESFRGKFTLWKPEWKAIVRKNRHLTGSKIATLINDPRITPKKVCAMRIYMKKQNDL